MVRKGQSPLGHGTGVLEGQVAVVVIEIEGKEPAVIQTGREGDFFFDALVLDGWVRWFGILDGVGILCQCRPDVLLRPQRCR